jgi:hypothetical protein
MHAFACRFHGAKLGLIRVCLCVICSQNKTLRILWLNDNQIGDAGAVSIGGALAYVTLSRFE